MQIDFGLYGLMAHYGLGMRWTARWRPGGGLRATTPNRLRKSSRLLAQSLRRVRSAVNLSWETLRWGWSTHNAPLRSDAQGGGLEGEVRNPFSTNSAQSTTLELVAPCGASRRQAAAVGRRHRLRHRTTSTTVCRAGLPDGWRCWRRFRFPAAILAEVRARYPALDPVRNGA